MKKIIAAALILLLGVFTILCIVSIQNGMYNIEMVSFFALVSIAEMVYIYLFAFGKKRGNSHTGKMTESPMTRHYSRRSRY